MFYFYFLYDNMMLNIYILYSIPLIYNRGATNSFVNPLYFSFKIPKNVVPDENNVPMFAVPPSRGIEKLKHYCRYTELVFLWIIFWGK